MRYTYRVKALRDGEQSRVSNYARIDLPDDYAQDTSGSDEPTPSPEALAPSGLTAEAAKDGGMALSWTAPAEDAGSVTGYEVLRAQGSAALATLVADTGGTGTTYTDSGVSGDLGDYRYQVKALRGADASQGSNVARVSVSLFDNSIVPRASVTLVSNTGVGTQEDRNTSGMTAQAFTTGSNTDGYTLASVDLVYRTGETDAMAASVCTVDSDGFPTSTCTALTAPATFAAGTVSFTAPSGTILTKTTTYTVLLDADGFVGSGNRGFQRRGCGRGRRLEHRRRV